MIVAWNPSFDGKESQKMRKQKLPIIHLWSLQSMGRRPHEAGF